MRKIEVLDQIGFYFSLIEDFERTEFIRIFLPFFTPSRVGIGGEIFKRIERMLIEHANRGSLKIVVNKAVLKKLPGAVKLCAKAVKDGLYVHSKVVICDPNIVYVGSANFTFDKLKSVINHTLRIEDFTIYLELKAKFESLFSSSF
jgi:phosphatidylserine/phosphatidylglycerophosphate/cardiolipin synthase-like enzyme